MPHENVYLYSSQSFYIVIHRQSATFADELPVHRLEPAKIMDGAVVGTKSSTAIRSFLMKVNRDMEGTYNEHGD